MGRVARVPLLALALLLTAGVRAGAEEPPTFLIERVVVEGLERESARQIVLSESLLAEGGTYSEPQLRDAVSRVKRLPFVVDADMALRKGSERGAYELVIAVEAAKPVAFALDVDVFYFDNRYLPGGADYEELAAGAAFTVSARKFVGARGLLFGSLQAYDDDLGVATFQLGYTRYGLFGAGSYATAALSSAVGDRYDKGNLQASAQVGIPITGNHALRASAAWTTTESRFGSYGGYSETQFEAWRGELEWLYDSTDDPLFATSGRRVTGAGAYGSSRQTHRVRHGAGNGEFDFDERYSNDSWLVSAQGRQYWPMTPKQSLGFGAGAEHSESFDVTGSSTSGYVEAIHAFNVWDFAVRERRRGDLRLETVLRVDASHYASDVADYDYDTREAQLRTSLLFRNAWGVYRLGFSYVAELENRR